MPTPKDIPQKVIDQILDELYEIDPKSIISCSTTSRAFLARCQKHIFSSISLGGVDLTTQDSKLLAKRCQTLNKSLRSNPLLPTLIDSLIFEVWTGDPPDNRLSDWIIKKKDAANLIHSSTSVSTFILHFQLPQAGIVPMWWSFNPALQTAIPHLLQNANRLLTLELECFLLIPASVFTQLPSTLIELKLHWLTIDYSKNVEAAVKKAKRRATSSPQSRPKLRVLNVLQAWDVLNFLYYPDVIDCSSLQLFEFHPSHQIHMDLVADILKDASESLKELTCNLAYPGSFCHLMVSHFLISGPGENLLPGPIDLGKLTSVQLMTFYINPDSANTLSSLLSTIPLKNPVKFIQINLRLKSMDEWRTMSNHALWSKLDKTFSKYSSIEYLTLRLIMVTEGIYSFASNFFTDVRGTIPSWTRTLFAKSQNIQISLGLLNEGYPALKLWYSRPKNKSTFSYNLST
jgi:hypothetical protein